VMEHAQNTLQLLNKAHICPAFAQTSCLQSECWPETCVWMILDKLLGCI